MGKKLSRRELERSIAKIMGCHVEKEDLGNRFVYHLRVPHDVDQIDFTKEEDAWKAHPRYTTDAKHTMDFLKKLRKHHLITIKEAEDSEDWEVAMIARNARTGKWGYWERLEDPDLLLAICEVGHEVWHRDETYRKMQEEQNV